jgi:hypothetical protein
MNARYWSKTPAILCEQAAATVPVDAKESTDWPLGRQCARHVTLMLCAQYHPFFGFQKLFLSVLGTNYYLTIPRCSMCKCACPSGTMRGLPCSSTPVNHSILPCPKSPSLPRGADPLVKTHQPHPYKKFCIHACAKPRRCGNLVCRPLM